jgi:TorA maturation chaperone TorD
MAHEHTAALRPRVSGGLPDSSAAEEQVRAEVYGLLSYLLAAPPDHATVATLAALDVPADAAEGSLAPAWRALQAAATRVTPESLGDEYAALFIGVGRGELVPYASWYLTGFLMELPLARLRGDLRSLRLERSDGVCEPEDHAASLCEAMAMLISGERAVGLGLQSTFFERHLDPWMGRFFRELQQAPSARFYRAVGQLGERFLEIEKRAFVMALPLEDDEVLDVSGPV